MAELYEVHVQDSENAFRCYGRALLKTRAPEHARAARTARGSTGAYAALAET